MTWTAETLAYALIQPWQHGDHVNAKGCTIAPRLDLSGATVRSFDMSQGTFGDDLVARNATFAGMAWLQSSHVKGVVDLAGSTFRSDLRLDGLRCETLDVSECRFEGVLSLDRARIGTLVLDHSLLLANLSMAGLFVSNSTSFVGTEVMGGMWAEDTHLHKTDATGLVVYGRSALLNLP